MVSVYSCHVDGHKHEVSMENAPHEAPKMEKSRLRQEERERKRRKKKNYKKKC